MAHFPYLTKVEILYGFNYPQLKLFLNLNPQLSSFVYQTGLDKWRKYIIPKHLQIKNIDFHLSRPNKHIHFRNLKHFSYDLGSNLFSTAPRSDCFPFTFDKLEKLNLSCIDHVRIDEIIKRNKNLVELSLVLYRMDISIYLSGDLAKLRTITFDVRDYDIIMERWNWKEDIDAMIGIINEPNFVTNIKFKVFSDHRGDVVAEYLDKKINKNKWKLARIGFGSILRLITKDK